MRVKKQQLEPYMEWLIGSKLGKEYGKAEYYHPVYLTYMCQWYRTCLPMQESVRCEFHPWVRKIFWRKAWHPLQYSHLENPMDRGARWATACRDAKSQTWPKWLNMHTHAHRSQLFIMTSLEASGAFWAGESLAGTQEVRSVFWHLEGLASSSGGDIWAANTGCVTPPSYSHSLGL